MAIGIRLHGRGGQGAVTASRLLAVAAYIDGKFSQAIPMYGTERRGAPVTAYVRVDDVRVKERELVHTPEIVIVLDQQLATRQNMADEMAPGGLLLLNADYPPEEVKISGDIRIATVDATGIALETLKRPITNTAILGAFSKAVGWPKLDSVEQAIRKQFSGRIADMNIEAVRRSYNEVKGPVQSQYAVDGKREELVSGGYGTLKDVSSWRVFVPVFDMDKCIGCKTCWIYCPETAIEWGEDNKPSVRWRACKGCGICVEECPVDAIEFKRVEIER
jgi:2-oxoacid:acceptor oxidoreductase gamma subunit (pyruvate/2-ketoisovalerate family)/2-oxoacid:acceptor oxidoreductase delta subunit (pyruvate/2-ketoisovalerate family)